MADKANSRATSDRDKWNAAIVSELNKQMELV
jgi:hypothetical protein